MDLFVLILVRALTGLLAALPRVWAVRVLTALVRLVALLFPKHARIARRNLCLAFPELTEAERERILRESYVSLARLLVDFSRLPKLDTAWVNAHIECPFLPRFREIKATHPGKGVVIATGHLGSFELLAHSVAMYGNPIDFVVRNFKLPRVDRWWTGIRERQGNRVISRKGAFRDVMRSLQSGRDVALLFDQNVTRNHAVFVPWFGVPAATTRSVALAALRTEAPVIVASIHHLGEDRYRTEAIECDFTPLYRDETISPDEKIERMTARMAAAYESMIRAHPGEWFWMHRRWKTRPEGEHENLYR